MASRTGQFQPLGEGLGPDLVNIGRFDLAFYFLDLAGKPKDLLDVMTSSSALRG
jgi:hypothetical protein